MLAREAIHSSSLKPARPRIAAVVLAAGEGRRLGRPKALLSLGEQTFLATILSRLADAGFSPRLAVVHPEVEPQLGVERELVDRILVNPDPGSGPLGSLQIALRQLPPDIAGTLMCLVDHPAVRQTTYVALHSAAAVEPEAIWQPVYEGRGGHPVYFPKALFPKLLTAPREQGARAVVYAHPEMRCNLIVADPYVRYDVDTEEAYKKLLSELSP